LFDDEFDDFEDIREKRPPKRGPVPSGRKRGRPPRNKDDDGDYRPTGSALKAKPKRIPILKQTASAGSSPSTTTPVTPSVSAADEGQQSDNFDVSNTSLDDSMVSASGDEPRSKRARKEKKIFDL
jgi:hypothetical protein